MRPSRSSMRLAVPAFPDPYGPRYIRERSRTTGFAVDRAEQKHRACGDTQQSKTGKRNLSRDGSAT